MKSKLIQSEIEVNYWYQCVLCVASEQKHLCVCVWECILNVDTGVCVCVVVCMLLVCMSLAPPPPQSSLSATGWSYRSEVGVVFRC